MVREGKVVGTSVVARVFAGDRSGRETTRTTLDAGGATVKMEAVAFFAAGGVSRREVQDLTFSKDTGRGTRLQTIAEYDASGANIMVTEKGVRKVSRIEAPQGLARGNPWRFGPPSHPIAAGTTYMFAEFDLTAVRWKSVTETYRGYKNGAFHLELAEGGRVDQTTVDAAGLLLTLDSGSGFSLRRKPANPR